MERSAHSLTRRFSAGAAKLAAPGDIALRETVGRLGREGERR
jgi:triphosphoribosyl-dephospho-CoA synthase